jgi:nucleoside 2-deoxyribosyltransferase
MRLYFSGAIAGGREHLPVYQHIVARLQAAGLEVPSAHVADPDVLAHEAWLSPRAVYERDIRWVEESEAMIAEVSTPSLGVGYEVAHALHLGKPVLCLYRRDLFISKMITGNSAPGLAVAAYADLAELDAHLDAFVRSLGASSAAQGHAR